MLKLMMQRGNSAYIFVWEMINMNRAFNNFMTNLPDYGTIARLDILMDVDKFHREIKLFVSNNRK